MALRIRTLIFSCVVAMTAAPAGAQSVLDRGPNLSDGWIGAPNSIHFNFLHRFNSSGAPQRQVTNRPTFVLAYRAPPPILFGVRYATRSDIVARIPNEWELFARYGAMRQDAGAPLDASATAAWNEAARSVDGEVTLARRQGALRMIAAARVLGSAFDTGETRFALAGGATLRLNRWIAIAGDVGRLLDADDDEQAAWGAALQFAVPYTPHSVSLQAANTNTATLHGASRGADAVRWGFEFTVPIAVGRYLGTRVVAAPPPPPPDLDSLRVAVADSVTRVLQREYDLRLQLDAAQRAARDDSLRAARAESLRIARADSVRAAARADSIARAQAARARRTPATAPRPVRATIRNLAYIPGRIEVTAGTTITWRNEDQLDHTVTAQDGTWDSGVIRPGATWQRTFATPGTYEFFCTPHPFMKGTIVVRPAS
ncbi:MAG: cupredoxin domain-containing protein [Longimicrobiales bacterium]